MMGSFLAKAFRLGDPDCQAPRLLSRETAFEAWVKNSYWMWGPGSCSGEVVLVIGDDRARLETLFTTVELGVTFTCRDCMPYEGDKPIWIARGLRMPIHELWPRLRKLI
jgi:hypothetical protein